MKWIDKSGRIGGKVHLFDLLVLLILLAGLIGMGSRFFQARRTEQAYLSATYTLEIAKVREFAIDAYRVGDTLYEKDVPVGTVTNVRVAPYAETELMPNGGSAVVPHAIFYSVTLTVSTDRLLDRDGYYINTQEFLNGTRHEVSNGFISCEGIVRELEVKK